MLDLEPAVAQAELILAVRLVDVTETKIVHGGRNVQVTEQYRFEPVRVLEGNLRARIAAVDRSRPGHLPVRGRVRTAAARAAHAGAAGPARPELLQLQHAPQRSLNRFRAWKARTTRCSRPSRP